ncbi:putative GNAT family N-acetyltransferase [Zalerion maritima]|uniref:GNAT family N-acetyltransferase n=1 Tax=Zalerion maritima TaxID=339359 RepID=A0AAD5RKH0_9PEZI|nr:putative GNAT family N-acetyltransferase [Zalerion maritima]
MHRCESSFLVLVAPASTSLRYACDYIYMTAAASSVCGIERRRRTLSLFRTPAEASTTPKPRNKPSALTAIIRMSRNRCYHKDNYVVSSDREHVQLDALNDAFGSDIIWWADRYPEDVLRKLVDTSMCFGVFCLPEGTQASEHQHGQPVNPKEQGKMIGFGRLVTDYVSAAYLTDVYILEPHQGKGLGKWLAECISEELDEWPFMRQSMLFCSDKRVGMYERAMGAREFVTEWKGEKSEGTGEKIVFMVKDGKKWPLKE